MLFCGIFISILNHINDSQSWRIRWGEKKPQTISCFQCYYLEALPQKQPSTLCSHDGWELLTKQEIWGTLPSQYFLHYNCYQADNGERALLTAAKSSKQSYKQNCLGKLSFGVAGFKTCICKFANNCLYLIQYRAYCNRKNAGGRRWWKLERRRLCNKKEKRP